MYYSTKSGFTPATADGSTKAVPLPTYLVSGLKNGVPYYFVVMECPAFYVPVLMRETGQKGADDGEG